MSDPTLVIIAIYLICLIHTILLVYMNHAGSREEDFSKNTVINFTRLSQNYIPLDWGHKFYNFLSPYPTDVIYQIWSKFLRRWTTRRWGTNDNSAQEIDGRKKLSRFCSLLPHLNPIARIHLIQFILIRYVNWLGQIGLDFISWRLIKIIQGIKQARIHKYDVASLWIFEFTYQIV